MGAPIGNSNAAKGKLWEAAILRAIEAYPEEPSSDGCSAIVVGLNKAASAFVRNMMASDGNVQFFKEFGDRLDGKPKQQIDVGGQADNPVRQALTIEFIGKAP